MSGISQLDIQKVLTLSTAHIKESTANRLDRDPDDNNLGLCVYQKADYGYFIYLDAITPELMAQYSESIPRDLYDCIGLALSVGCNILCLDCDGEELPFLPTYDW